MSGATPFDPVRLAIEGAIARLTLDQPARHNALGLAALEALESAIAQAEHTDGVRVLIIDAAPGPTFCAGAALDELADGRLTPARFHAFLDRLAQCTLPTIAAISGHVHGGGAELPLACDFRIGVDTLRLQVPATRIGLCYPPPGIRRYTRLLGASVAKRILLAGEVCDTTTLQQIGYLDQSVQDRPLKTKQPGTSGLLGFECGYRQYRGRPPPPPSRRGGRSSRGRASLTRRLRPDISLSFKASMAALASASLGISTKPKPLDCPENLSVITVARDTSP